MNIELREYQKDAILDLSRRIAKNKRVILCLPTGAGKTVIFTSIIVRFLNKNDFNKLKFDEASTESYGLNNSFSKRIFSSIRKRAQNRLDTLTK